MWPWKRIPTCPVDDSTRDWVDFRFQWLIHQFGINACRDAAAVLPLAHFFPDRYDGSEHAVRQMLDRVCGYMAVRHETVRMHLMSDDRDLPPRIAAGSEHSTSAAGTFHVDADDGMFVVRLNTKQLANPMSLAATIAHELAHARLLGENRLSSNEDDHEKLTDLCTVFFGMGLFCANSVIDYAQWTRGNSYGWRASKLGYLDEPTFGYALGLWAWARGERKPKWFRHLRLNVRVPAKQTIAYLQARTDGPWAKMKLAVAGAPAAGAQN